VKNPTSHIFDFTPESLKVWCIERGMPAYRAAQILDWVYARGVVDPAQMSNLAKRDRDVLLEEMTFLSGQTVLAQKASDGTQKLLVQWEDFEVGAGCRGDEVAREGEKGTSLRVLGSSPVHGGGLTTPSDSSRQTECVMIPVDADERDGEEGEGPTRSRRTACISSQVGCPVGCKFCASGIGGLDGNLSAGRIVEQVWRLRSLLDSAGVRGGGGGGAGGGIARISNVVFMGMGEPLANFQNVVRAVRTLNAPWGMGIGARKITISTVGLPKAIEKLAEELEVPVTLALSLHAPNDQIRRRLIPWAEYTTIPELLSACQKWFEKTKREITLEYILLGGVNDRPEHARELAEFARTVRGNVNLIRYNEVRGMPFVRPEDGDVLEFQRILRAARVNTHIRASRGRDIAAACGQLRHEAGTTAA